MRAVSFVDKIEVEFGGTVFHEALSIGDVDNDSLGELVIGNTDGNMAIFKGKHSDPWMKAASLGMITCIQIGDTCNLGKNSIVVMTAEAQCHIFNIESSRTQNASSPDSDNLSPDITQTIPANSKAMILSDYDKDGKIELVVAYSDRVVRSFRWTQTSDTLSGEFGELQALEKWQLAGQIGALTTNIHLDGSIDLMASQPGGTFVTLLPAKARKWKGPTECSDDKDIYDYDVPALVYHPLNASSRATPATVSTQIVGCLQWRENRSLYALSALDGTIMVVDNDEIVWSRQVDHQLFSLNTLDVTGNGIEELIICAWDGNMYIIDNNHDVVKYQCEESVAAFTCGMYGMRNNINEPCFVYTTFNDKVHIFYNLELSSLKPSNLLLEMDKQQSTKHCLDAFGIKDDEREKQKQLYRWCLYGNRETGDR